MGDNISDLGQSTSDWPHHADVSRLLHVYADALMRGEDVVRRYPQVARHLDRCAVCTQDLRELLEGTRAAYDPQGEPAPVPRPDLSRLRRPAPTRSPNGVPWLVNEAGKIWLEFTAALLEAWRPPALLGAARGELLFRYGYPAGERDPGLDLEIYGEAGSTTTVLVQITLPDLDPLSQAGTTVTLYVDGRPLREVTDDTGTARFTGVPREALERLRLEITPGRSA